MGQPNLAVGNLVRVRIRCRMQQQLSVNTIDYQVLAASAAMTPQMLADAYSLAMAPSLKTFLCALASYSKLTVQVQSGAIVQAQVESFVGAGTGFPGSDPLPKQVAGLIQKRTDFAGRQFRGRLYMPFPYKDVADLTGNVSGTQHDSMTTFASIVLVNRTYASGGESVTVQPVLRHKAAGVNVTPIVSSPVSYSWATQRRRGDFGRAN